MMVFRLLLGAVQSLRRPGRAGLLAAALLLPGLVMAATPVLRVLAWPGYADADIVKAFETRFNAKVEVTIVGSDDVLRDKLAAPGQPGYDVVAANTVEIQRLLSRQLLAPIPLADVPHASRQLPRFLDRAGIPGITQAREVYALPFTYSDMGLIYDRRQLAVPPDSLSVLWDPGLRGRVLAFDASNHNFSLAAQSLGLMPFHIQDGQFSAVARRLVALRRNVKAFYTLPEESVELFRRHGAAVLWANYGRQQLKLMQDAGLDVGYVVPREGALAWLDCWAILRASRQVPLAAQWLNHMLSPEVSATFSRRQGLPNTLRDELPGGAAGPLLWLEPLEDEGRRSQLWQRIMAGDRPERF